MGLVLLGLVLLGLVLLGLVLLGLVLLGLVLLGLVLLGLVLLGLVLLGLVLFRLLLPSSLLSISFVHLEVETWVSIHLVDIAVFRMATVAGKHITRVPVEHRVNDRRNAQNRESDHMISHGQRNAAQQESEKDDRHTPPLRKVLPHKQLVARANQASSDMAAGDGACRDLHRFQAVRANDLVGFVHEPIAHLASGGFFAT